MKIYLFAFTFFVFASNMCWAQVTIKRVPLLKESAKIDSLLTLVVNSRNIKGVKNDSCLLLGLMKGNNDAGFIQDVHMADKKNIIYDYWNFNKRNNLGYFEWKGYLIFVYFDSFMQQFFTPLRSNKEFSFFKSDIGEDVSVFNNFMNWVVFYHDGEFSYGLH